MAVSDWFLADTYSSPEEEVEAVLARGGIFDASADSRVRISGEGHIKDLNKLVTCSLKPEGSIGVADGFVLNDRGGIIDTLEILQNDRFCLLHGHFTVRSEMVQWWRTQLEQTQGIQLVDTSETQGSVVVIGPAVDDLLQSIVLDGSLPAGEDQFGIVQIGQARCLALRRRLGWLPYWRLDAGTAFLDSLWNTLTATGSSHGIVPVGWRAMESLRIELGIPRIGAEMDDSTTPLEIGASDKVDFQKRVFPGRRALLHSTCGEFSRRLVHLEIDSLHPPAPGSPLESEGVRIGRITSSIYSPRKRNCYAMGFVDALRAVPGVELQARTLDQIMKAVVLPTENLAR